MSTQEVAIAIFGALTTFCGTLIGVGLGAIATFVIQEYNYRKIKLEQSRTIALEWAKNGRKASLRKLQLKGVILSNIDLGPDESGKGVDLSYANLERVDLHQANLKNANLSYANLTGAVLSKANLEGANLSFSLGNGATLNESNLQGVEFEKATFKDAQFIEANLNGALFIKTNLQSCNFSNANFLEANLYEADLRGSNISQEQLSKAITYDKAQL